jgi:hypothetical protein
VITGTNMAAADTANTTIHMASADNCGNHDTRSDDDAPPMVIDTMKHENIRPVGMAPPDTDISVGTHINTKNNKVLLLLLQTINDYRICRLYLPKVKTAPS